MVEVNRQRRFHEEHGGWYAARGKVHEEHDIKDEQVGSGSIRSMMDRSGRIRIHGEHDDCGQQGADLLVEMSDRGQGP